MLPFPLLTALLLLAPQADTGRLGWVPDPRRASGGWVSDPAHHLRPATVAAINATISDLERTTTAEIAVVVLDSLDGLTPHDAAFQLHRRWGVGKANRDNGIVLLWSPKLREIYTSVGYGLEGVLPDARAGRIQRETMIPLFSRDDFDGGMLLGVQALAAVAREETYSGLQRSQSARPARNISSRAVPVGWILGSAIAFFAAIIGGVKSWRYRPRKCPKGHGRMRRLHEEEDDAFLGREGALEERLGSMDYDVYVCASCDQRVVYPYRKWFSKYEQCPKCKRRVCERSTKTLVAATTMSTGTREVTRICRNFGCRWTHTFTETIPRVAESSGGSGGSGGGGGGGGSSFGGGSSGGGGAGSSY